MAGLRPRPCIVCGNPTTDRSEPHRHPRCASFWPCAIRRDAQRVRSRLRRYSVRISMPVKAGDEVTIRGRRAYVETCKVAEDLKDAKCVVLTLDRLT